MFQSARLKLTAWYLAIIMLVSVTFSFAFYQASTLEIQRVIVRIHFLQSQATELSLPTPPEAIFTLDQLQGITNRLKIALVIINGIILVIAGGAGYFLAGRTLKPIQQMVDEQNQFISDASHELRTPIATLRAEMEASLLEKRLSDKGARKVIASNLEELGKLQELANSLLQLAHVSKKNVIYNDTVSMQEVIQSAYKKVSSLAKKKQIIFTLSQVSGKVKGDKNSLIEVFVNLFDNAIKYSPEKTKVTIASMSKKRSVTILVTDEGVGIAPTDLEHIFDRFYRADKSRSQADGHGLGLSIVKKIVTAHNGSIEVDSVYHKGTTFTLTFPLVS
ncbi:MAG TPA: HAMP domain-containing sensor histidine kinase [Candidatus Acidoferrales bacterium]|nr:HAMP domain-containing sensor histidine kinase [Candidatus Acidoferrales bacterium]